MSKYETTVIFSLKAGEEKAKELVEKFKALIEANGTLEAVDEWGQKTLAYEINYETEGYYVLYFKETLDESNWEMQVKDSLAYDKIDSDIKSHEAKVLDEEKLQSVIDATMVLAKKQIAAAAESATASY